MKNNLKKYVVYVIMAALAWLPAHVAFTASFVMPASTPTQISTMSKMNLSPAVVAKQAGPTTKGMNMPHCNAHKNIKKCCQTGTTCNMSDQGCNKCLTFVAMSYLHRLPQFIIQHQTQYSLHQPLISTIHSLYIRPPRTA